MKIIWAQEPIPTNLRETIFLAGPSPRSPKVLSWRPRAVKLLAEAGFEGVVLVPEVDGGGFPQTGDKVRQHNWELEALNAADVVMFWIDRSQDMPGRTTNIEWGRWATSGKAVLGLRDEKADHYIAEDADHLGVPRASSLSDAVRLAADQANRSVGKVRTPANIPASLSASSEFARWVERQHGAGNQLVAGEIIHVFPITASPFLTTTRVSMKVGAEDRLKDNELIISRSDISVVVAYTDTKAGREILLVKEFRSPCTNRSGYVYECPGGSSPYKKVDPHQLALNELQEETGLSLAPERLISHGDRQLLSTLSIHHAHVFSVHLNTDEVQQIHDRHEEPIIDGTEITHSKMVPLTKIINERLVDWSMLGIILSVTHNTQKHENTSPQ